MKRKNTGQGTRNTGEGTRNKELGTRQNKRGTRDTGSGFGAAVSGLPADGLECPGCGCRHFSVVYTRPWRPGRIVRRRECRHCGRRMTTIEQALEAPEREIES